MRNKNKRSYYPIFKYQAQQLWAHDQAESRKIKSRVKADCAQANKMIVFVNFSKWPKKHVSPLLPCSHSFRPVTSFILVSGHLNKNWGYLSCLCVRLANSVLLTPWLRETFRSLPSQCALYVLTDLQSVAWTAFGASRLNIRWDAFLIWCSVSYEPRFTFLVIMSPTQTSATDLRLNSDFTALSAKCLCTDL